MADQDAATAPQLSNQMTDEQRAKLTFQHRDKFSRLLAEKKEKDAAFRNFCKEVKSDLGVEGLANIKDMIALASDGEDAIKAEMERKARVLRWMGYSVGTQADLFPEDRRPIAERAFAEGKLAGISGEPFRNPYHPTNDGWKPYETGWRAGQDVKLAKFAPLDTAAAADSLADA